MAGVTFMVAGPLHKRTGGSIYNRRMAETLMQHGWTVRIEELDDSFPLPTCDALSRAADAFACVPDGAVVLADGLAYGAMPDVVAAAAHRVRPVALVHLPLAATVGLDGHEATRLALQEQVALSHAQRVIVTGANTLTLMQQCGLSHPDVVVVEPGTDPAPLATGSRSDRVHLLTVATLNAGKGYELLLEALAMLPHRRFHLTCAGSATRDPATAERVAAAVTRLGLVDEVSLLGELTEQDLNAAYDKADVVVLASLRETYGMTVAEALARGLPVVATSTGAIRSLVGEHAGAVVPPGDPVALAGALRRMIDDAPFRASCAEGARRARATLQTWEDAAARLAAALTLAPAHG